MRCVGLVEMFVSGGRLDAAVKESV